MNSDLVARYVQSLLQVSVICDILSDAHPGWLQSNLKLDVEIQKIPSSAMIENVASYLKKGVS